MWFAFVLPINCQLCALRSVGRKSVMSRLTNKDFLESKCVKRMELPPPLSLFPSSNELKLIALENHTSSVTTATQN